MASRRRTNDTSGRAGRIIGWAFVLSTVFSAGLILGMQLDGDPQEWLVSTSQSDGTGAESGDKDAADESKIFSFYEKLSGGEPPDTSTTAEASDSEVPNADKPGDSDANDDSSPSNSALYTVQISAFPDLARAESELESLIAKGLNPHVVAAPGRDDQTYYRLRVGRYSSIDAAEAARKRLTQQLDSEPVVTDF